MNLIAQTRRDLIAWQTRRTLETLEALEVARAQAKWTCKVVDSVLDTIARMREGK